MHQSRAVFLASRPNVDKLFKDMVEKRKVMSIDEFFENYKTEIDPEGRHPVQVLGYCHHNHELKQY